MAVAISDKLAPTQTQPTGSPPPRPLDQADRERTTPNRDQWFLR